MLKNSSYTFLMVTLATVSFYAWSVAHFNALLSVFNLNYTVLEKSFYQTLYYGFLHSFGNLLIFVVYVLVLFFLVYMITTSLPEVISWIKKEAAPSSNNKPESLPAKLSKKIALSCLCFVLVLVLFLLSLSYMEKNGRELGLERLASFSSDDMPQNHVINVKVDGENKELFLIECGSANCAGLEGETDLIYYFPIGSGFSFKFNRGG